MRLAFFYHPSHVVHNPPDTSPENPRRLEHALHYLDGPMDYFTPPVTMIRDFPPATKEDLLLVHDPDYVSFVEGYCQRGGGFLGDSTYFARKTPLAARLSAGAAIATVSAVARSEHDAAISFMRPPGHHAGFNKYGGYCIFNNGAIAARFAQSRLGKQRIMILDWDGHAGDGTQQIFYEDPTVLTISMHRAPHDFYPREGFGHQIGRGAGRGYNINIELPEWSGDKEYSKVFDALVEPLHRSFRPDLIIGINGIDAHHSEKNVHLQLTYRGFHEIVSRARAMSPGNVALITEGGYTDHFGKITHVVAEALQGNELPIDEVFDSLSSAVIRQERIADKLDKTIADLKLLLREYHQL